MSDRNRNLKNLATMFKHLQKAYHDAREMLILTLPDYQYTAFTCVVSRNHEPMTSSKLAGIMEWQVNFAGSTLKELCDLGLLERQRCYNADGMYYEYREKK